MGSKFNGSTNRATKALKELEALNKRLSGKENVKVGLPSSSNAYPDGTSVIMVGSVHEFGSPSRNIPQRSFLRSTLMEKRGTYKGLFRKLSKDMTSNDMDIKTALSKLGLIVVNDVRSKIIEIKEPPLKHRDGNPLNDTGHLRQSITYEVE